MITTTEQHGKLLEAVENYTHALHEQNLIDRQQFIADVQVFLAPYSPIPAKYKAAYETFEEMATMVGYGQQKLGRGMNKFMDYVWDTTEKSLVIPSPNSANVLKARENAGYLVDYRIVSHPQNKWVLQGQNYKGGHWRNHSAGKLGYEAAYTLLILKAEENDYDKLPEIKLTYPEVNINAHGIAINYNNTLNFRRQTCELSLGRGYGSQSQTLARFADVAETVNEVLNDYYRRQLERPAAA